MAAGQSVRGFFGQNMAGRKPNKLSTEPYSFPVTAAAYSFTVPKSGYWKFVAWGPGGVGSNTVTAGASGSYGEITKFLPLNAVVTVSVTSGADTVLTFPDGVVATAGKGALAVAGAATGFDFSLAGTAGAATGTADGGVGLGTGGGVAGTGQAGPGSGGSGAPGRLPYRGGAGAGANTSSIGGIGAGGVESGANTRGQGHALAVFMRP